MTLEFNENVVNNGNIDCENFKFCKFIGYLNKYGQAIDYSMPFGLGGHDNNPITDLFVEYFYISNKKNLNFEIFDFESKKTLTGIEYEKIIYERYRKELKIALKNIKKRNKDELYYSYNNLICPHYILEQDLLEFFYNCYQNNSFNNGYGKDFYIMTKEEFYWSSYYQNILKKYPSKEGEDENTYNNRIPTIYQFDFMYWHYKMKSILGFFKDTLIQYLGYHAIERIPKTITTSETNIYSTFYNYLLNDFNIVRIPKMKYDKNKKMYIEYNHSDFLLPDSELQLKDEIQSIKKLIPLKEKYKYYRN